MSDNRKNSEEFEKSYFKLKESYGEPREGYGEFIKSCIEVKPFLSPTQCPTICKGYKLPCGLYLHDVMLQTYYDSRTMVARDSDILVDSYPKTGTTWSQEICYLILHDGDIEKANSTPLEDRIPFLEIPSIGISGINNLPSPRLIKSHLPYDELPSSFLKQKTKIVYICRNPKDTVVSLYYFVKRLTYYQYKGDLGTFLDSFLAGRVMYGSFAEHVLSFWKRRNDGNILFLTYEDLQQDFRNGILKMAKFLGKNLSESQVGNIENHCRFESMSKNPMTNYSKGVAVSFTPGGTFMRSGKVGDWKNYFTDEMNKKMDAYVEKEFRGSGIQFKYDV